MRETQLVRDCLAWLNMQGHYCWRNNTTGVYDPRRGRFRPTSGPVGAADILGVLKGGRFLACEVKIRPNKPTPAQLAFLDVVRACGGLALVVYDVGELIKTLEENGHA